MEVSNQERLTTELESKMLRIQEREEMENIAQSKRRAMYFIPAQSVD